MTAPIQPLPIPDVQGQWVPPQPGVGDAINQGAGDLVKVLMALRQLSQTSQIENRQLDVQRELGMGNIGVQRDEQNRLRSNSRYEQQQASDKLARETQAGSALLNLLPQNVQQGLQGAPGSSIPGMVPQLEQMGAVGPQTGNQRDFAALKGMSPEDAKKYWDLIGPKAGTVINNNVGGKPSPLAEEISKKDADFYSTAVTRANASLAALPKISEGLRLLKDKKVITGAGADLRQFFARGIAALGGSADDMKAGDTQTYVRLARESTLAYLANKSAGQGQVSDRDMRFLEDLSGSNINLQQSALERVSRINFGTQLGNTEDAVVQLRQIARESEDPRDAKKLNARADQIERQIPPARAEYNRMLEAEKMQGKQTNAKTDQRLKQILGGGNP